MNATPKERSRASYLKNRERVLARSKENYEKNKGKRASQIVKWRLANPDKVKAAEKRSRLKRIQKCRAACRKWYWNNRDQVRQQKAARKRELRADPIYGEQERRRTREWLKSHPDVVRRNSQKRRALKRKASVNLKGISRFFQKVRQSKSVTCYYCGVRISGRDCHFDHIIPLSRGGQHGVENLCVACQFCNLSKGSRTPQAWINIGQQLLAL